MSRTILRLTADHLPELVSPCRSCTFWQCEPVRRGRIEDPAAEVASWVSEVLRDWGSCGRVAIVDGRPVGHVFYAPEAFLPGTVGLATAPAASDAVVLAVAHVEPGYRDGGLGRMLVQHMARDLVTRDVRAVEAYADSRGPGRCVLPEGFLSGVGFKTQRALGTSVRMRMDLRAAVTWRRDMGAAWERLVDLVDGVRPGIRPGIHPAPSRQPGTPRVVRR
jgi:GNAT superfamily N-acetyltransferase